MNPVISITLRHIHCADSSCTKKGRIRGSSFPAEVDLARLVAKITNPHPSWKTTVPLEKWHGVRLSKDGELEHIFWGGFSGRSKYGHKEGLRGELIWRFLPTELQTFAINCGMDLKGMVPLNELPASMTHLSLRYCQYSGPLDFSQAPSEMRTIHLDHNEFSGPLELSQLPPNMYSLRLEYNRFSGEITLKNLPKDMNELFLTGNKLSGSLCLIGIQDKLRILALDDNNFEGCVDLTSLPRALRELYLQKNKLSGSVRFDNIPQYIHTIDLSNNEIKEYEPKVVPHCTVSSSEDVLVLKRAVEMII